MTTCDAVAVTITVAAVVISGATDAASPPETSQIIQHESAINAHIKFRLNNNQDLLIPEFCYFKSNNHL